MSRLVAGYRALCLALPPAVLAVLGLNAAAARLAPGRPAEADVFRPPAELLATEPEVLREIYGDRPEAELRALLRPPPFASHPRLAFRSRPSAHEPYRVGVEGLRLGGTVTATGAAAGLAGGVWVFGGSTVFGSGVRGDETVVAALGRQDPGRLYLNFGVIAATQRLEIDHLVHLLEKGHRPSRVIFLDGLNDALAVLASPFAAEETPARPPAAYAFDFGPHRLESAPLGLWLRSTALWRWWAGPFVTPRGADLDDPDSLYVRDPWAHWLGRPPLFAHDEAQLADAARRLVRLHRANLELLGALGRGYGFEVAAFLQPNGLLRTDHPFLRDPAAYPGSPIHRAAEALSTAARVAIADGRLAPMVDLSEADRGCEACYVDAVHYDARLADRLAAAILASSAPPRLEPAGP